LDAKPGSGQDIGVRSWLLRAW